MHKDLFVLGAELAHKFVVRAPYMALEVCQMPASDITATVGAIETEEENGIIVNVSFFILDASDIIRLLKVPVRKVFVALVGVVCEDNVLGLSLYSFQLASICQHNSRQTDPAMCTLLVLVQSPHSQSTDVACSVVTRCNGVMHYGRSTNEADFCLYCAVVALTTSRNNWPPFAFPFFGIFGQAITEAATTAKTWRWW